MKDDLNFFENGRRPQVFENVGRPPFLRIPEGVVVGFQNFAWAFVIHCLKFDIWRILSVVVAEILNFQYLRSSSISSFLKFYFGWTQMPRYLNLYISRTLVNI
jgi:hypothetical protein